MFSLSLAFQEVNLCCYIHNETTDDGNFKGKAFDFLVDLCFIILLFESRFCVHAAPYDGWRVELIRNATEMFVNYGPTKTL